MQSNNRRALIFGISGQDGAYLADLLLRKGIEVHGTSRDKESAGFSNLRALQISTGSRCIRRCSATSAAW